jgi:hypothetical protein
VGTPRAAASATSTSVGFSTRLVTITAITPDGKTAVAVDRQGTEVRVSMQIQPAKGILPAPGEQRIITQDLTNTWTFAAIATSDSEVFTNPAVAGTGPLDVEIPPPAPGSIPGSAIEPGSLTGNEIAIASITNLNLATAAAATNIILDPQFTSSGVNAVRQADPGTTCTWTFARPNVSVAGGLAVCTLAMMPSTLVPLYVNPGEQYYVSIGVTLPAGAPGGISAGIQFAYSDGSFGGPVLPVAAGAQTVAQLVTIPAGVASAYVRLIISGLPSGVTATFTGPVCYITQGPNQLQPGSVGSANLQANSVYANALQAGSVSTNALQANSVNASKITANSIGVAQLQVGLVMAGIVDATTVTGATLQNNAGNPKTSINPDGSITITNAAGIVIFKIGPDGTIDWYNSAGNLQMELQPGGTQAIYQSLTGPFSWGFDPPSAPVVLSEFTSNISSATYVNGLVQAVKAGSVVTVIASASGATDATGVTDAAGNTYTLVRSVTTGQHLQVFQAVNVAALASGAGLTVTFGAANSQEKNMIVLASSFVPTVTPLDFSASASGTSTAPSVTGTPTAYGDSLLFIGSWATAGGAGTMPDAWQQASQVNVAGQHWTGIWYSMNISGAAVAATAAITSAAWAGVLLGYKASPAIPLSAGPVPTSATLTPSTLWADDGVFSCRVTKVGTATQWGITFPPFSVQPGAQLTTRVVIGALNIALGTFETGVTFWSGPNGTGSNLGNWFVSWGTLAFNQFHPRAITNITVPAGAVSATAYALEKQADTAGQWFLIDNLIVPGGLAYSNSPVATSDTKGNQIEQGINFIGLPGLTNVFGVEDPYVGTQLASIDGLGHISGVTVSAATDMTIAGQSLLDDLISPMSQGVVARGWTPSGGWPSTPVGTTNTPILELDQVLPAGRGYKFSVVPTTFIPTAAGTQYVMQLRATTDGSTPTTSSAILRQSVIPCSNANLNHMTPACEYVPGNLAADTPYRLLVTANVQAGSFQYQGSLELRIEDLGEWTSQQFGNNGLALGTGSGGGSSVQTYVEHFYGNETWSYNEYGLRNYKGTMYQGAYSGEGFAQHSWIQWSGGDRGNSLNTVLNYTVSKVSLRTLCQHTWYNSGMTVSLHSSSGSVGNLGAISGELGTYTAKAGQFQEMVLPGSVWAPFKAGGVTRMVLRPPGGSTDLGYYGYFWGGGNNNSNVPRLTVTYQN